jgi:tRNA A-37 threonylcarbamoyl transferase component Bud32
MVGQLEQKKEEIIDLNSLLKDPSTRLKLFRMQLHNYMEFVGVGKADDASIISISSSFTGAQTAGLSYLDTNNQTIKKNMVWKRILFEDSFQTEIEVYERLARVGPLVGRLRPILAAQTQEGFIFATKAENYLATVEFLIKSIFAEFLRNQNIEILKQKLFKLCIEGVKALVKLHQLGIIHNDPFPKNIAIMLDTGQSFAFDFEYSELLEEGTNVHVEDSINEFHIFYEEIWNVLSELDTNQELTFIKNDMDSRFAKLIENVKSRYNSFKEPGKWSIRDELALKEIKEE